ncbi:unnamed protein product [Meloidogyne enterolobii]|uniref:Uncharacterized protein n=1 Tax=Meloidogyne enterolobii TaxID=390850 RepID=A0ACB0XWX8_MELEN
MAAFVTGLTKVDVLGYPDMLNPKYTEIFANSSASNTAHKIVNKTERAVHSGASDLSKAAHKGINKTQKAAKSLEKDAKKAVKHK